MVTLASRAFSNLAASEGAERRSSPAPLRAPDDAPRRGSAAAAALDDDERRLRRRESQALGAAADRVTPSPAALKRMSQVGLAPPGAGHLSISAIAKLKSKAKQAREHTQQNRKKRAAIVDTRAHHDDADGDADDDDRERPPAVKSAASKAAILDALRDHRYFSAIPTKELLRMAKTTREVLTYAGANILTQGEHGDEFYVLESGAAEILVDDVKVGAYGAGATFGELALLYRAPRAATIRALEDCRCWVVDSKTFRKVVIDARRAQESSRADFLRKLPLFADFDFVFLSRLANSLETCRFQRGEAIIRQGDVGESMFIIEAGAVKVEQSAGFRTRHLVTLRPGDYFGEMALLHNLPRAATCIAECEEDEVLKSVFVINRYTNNEMKTTTVLRTTLVMLYAIPPDEPVHDTVGVKVWGGTVGKLSLLVLDAVHVVRDFVIPAHVRRSERPCAGPSAGLRCAPVPTPPTSAAPPPC